MESKFSAWNQQKYRFIHPKNLGDGDIYLTTSYNKQDCPLTMKKSQPTQLCFWEMNLIKQPMIQLVLHDKKSMQNCA